MRLTNSHTRFVTSGTNAPKNESNKKSLLNDNIKKLLDKQQSETANKETHVARVLQRINKFNQPSESTTSAGLDALFYSASSFWGPDVPKGAQKLLAAAYILDCYQHGDTPFDANGTGNFDFEKFSSCIQSQAKKLNISIDLKRSYFENIVLIDLDGQEQIEFGGKGSDYHIAFPIADFRKNSDINSLTRTEINKTDSLVKIDNEIAKLDEIIFNLLSLAKVGLSGSRNICHLEQEWECDKAAFTPTVVDAFLDGARCAEKVEYKFGGNFDRYEFALTMIDDLDNLLKERLSIKEKHTKILESPDPKKLDDFLELVRQQCLASDIKFQKAKQQIDKIFMFSRDLFYLVNLMQTFEMHPEADSALLKNSLLAILDNKQEANEKQIQQAGSYLLNDFDMSIASVKAVVEEIKKSGDKVKIERLNAMLLHTERNEDGTKNL